MKNMLLVFAFLPLFMTGEISTSAPVSAVEDQAKFVEDYAVIDSFDELLKRFEGRTVYIDLWATWCIPCVAEFKHKDELHNFTKNHDIDVLYISVDQDKDDEKWKSMIAENNLSGYHLRASRKLGNDIRQLFSRKIDRGLAFSIPYYIIAKDGEVTLKNAPRPSSKDHLFDELKKHL